jgi:hypothetical protein
MFCDSFASHILGEEVSEASHLDLPKDPEQTSRKPLPLGKEWKIR